MQDAGFMFDTCYSLTNLGLDKWKLESMTNLYCMFYHCESLEQIDLSSWNVEDVTNMGGMFLYCKNLKEANLNGWNTKSVTEMSNMFRGCSALEELPFDIACTGENASLSCMYEECDSLKSINISTWNIGNVDKLSAMFYGCTALESVTIKGWNVAGKDVAGMFEGCSKLQTADISNWNAVGADLVYMFRKCSGLHTINMSGVNAENADLSSMFSNCDSLQNINVTGWNTKGVKSMSEMFLSCKGLKQLDMSTWNFAGVGEMDEMFAECSALEKINLKGCDLSSVTSMQGMFAKCCVLNEIDFSDIDTSNVTSMQEMFMNCSGLEQVDVSDLDTSNVTHMISMFEGCTSLKRLDLRNFDTSKVKYMTSMFHSCSSLEELKLEGWDTSSVVYMPGMFYGCDVWKDVNLGSLNTQNVTNMTKMFAASTLTEINLDDLNGLDMSNVQNLDELFAGSVKLKKVNLSGMNIGRKDNISLSEMFYGCSALEEVNLSNWNTEKVRLTREMFEDCYSLKEVDLSTWNTMNLYDAQEMFRGCKALTKVDLSTWDTRKLYQAYRMFYGCSSLETMDFNSWKTDNLYNASEMFSGCNGLTEIDLGNFDMRNSGLIAKMLNGCESLTYVIAPRNIISLINLPVKEGDVWYLSDGSSITSIPQRQNYSPAIRRNSIPDPSEDRRPIENIVVDGIEINGKGFAHVRFQLLNNNGNLQRNKNVFYRFASSVDGSVLGDETQMQVALAEKDGYVTIQSPVFENESGENEEITLATHLWLEDENNGKEELLYTVTFHVTVKPLSFTQSWELGVEGTVTGKVSEGVGAKVGVASVEATLAEAEISGTIGGNLSVEHEFDGDVRNLTLLQTYNAKVAANATVGLAGEAKLLGSELDVDILSTEAGIEAGAMAGIGLELENYDPQNLGHITEIGKFIMASQAQATGNAMLLRLVELTGVNFYNLTQVGNAISVASGANVGAIEFDEVTEGNLLSAGTERVFSYEVSRNREDDSKEYTFSRNGVDEVGLLNLSQDVGIGEIETKVFSSSLDTTLEIGAEVDRSGQVGSFSVKKEEADSNGSIYSTGTIDAVEVSYDKNEARKLAKESTIVNKFVNGSAHYVMGNGQKELFEALDATTVEGSYVSSKTNQNIVEVEFEVGLTAGLGLEAGVAFEGAHSYEYAEESGSYSNGKKQITSTSDVADLVKEKDEEYNIVKLVVEPLTTVIDSVKDFLVDASEDIKEGVRNALAELKKSQDVLEENLPDWILHLVAVKEDENADVTVSQSYEIMAYSAVEEIALLENEEATVEEQKVYTVGDPYSVYVTDYAGNEVADYSESPLELILKYTDEMLAGAGVSERDLEKMAIYQYSQELYGYVCRGGELDRVNKCVSLTITKPGQYLLAVDTKAPTVTKIEVEPNGNKPTIRVNFDEDCGFKEFSLKIDDEECIGTDEWGAYYNAALRQIAYLSKTELSDGEHILSIYAEDGAGNAMQEPVTYPFRVDTQAPVLKNMEISAANNTLVIKAWTDDTDILSITSTVSQNMLAEVVKTSELKMTLNEGYYQAEMALEEGVDSVCVSLLAKDKHGNISEPLVETKNLEGMEDSEDVKEGLCYVFTDGNGLDHSEYTYTGSAIKPKVLIYDGKVLLTEKKDYTLSYSKNINAGQGVITVKGRGNYADRTEIKFTILPKDISNMEDETVNVVEMTAVKNGKVQKPLPVIKYNKKKLSNKNNKDFAVTYPDTVDGAYKEAGSYIVHVKGNGNYTGERNIFFMIGGKKTSKLSVSKIAACEYNGSAFTPEVTVKDGKNPLVKGTHYTVDYKNNIEVGTASVIITGIAPAYVGTKTITFKINGVSMSKVKIAGLPKSVYYSGEAHKPQLTLTYNDEPTLTEGTHYLVEYGENIQAGKGSITITGKGKFNGTIKKTFKILPFETKTDKEGLLKVQSGISIVHAKGGAKPQPEVTYKGIVLTNGTDYVLSYSNNKSVTTAATKKKPSVTVKFKGNYKGSLKTDFMITPQSLAELTISGVDKVENSGKNKWKSTVVITDLDQLVLKSGTDYESTLGYYLDQECTMPANANTYGKDTVIWVKVTGKGNYANSETVTCYRILEKGKSITNAKVKIKDQIYNGGNITIESSQIEYVKVNGKELTLDEHYVIIPESYKNNIKKGTATVGLRGIDEYGGTYTAKFKIKEKAFKWKDLLDALGINLGIGWQ